MKLYQFFILGLMLTIPFLAQSNSTPIADAGDNRVVAFGQQVVLDGDSSDPEDAVLQYQWSIVSRPTESKANLVDATSEHPSFFADQEGNFVIRLRVSDGILISSHDDVLISVVANSRPIAIVNADQSLQPGQTAQLDASASFDLEQSELSFRWAIDVAPSGSNARIFRPLLSTTNFIPDVAGLYLVRVFVSDSLLQDEAYVVIQASGQTVIPPTANAGPDTFVAIRDTVMLNGQDSDSGDLPLTYSWQIERAPTGSKATIISPTSIGPSFTPDLDGEYFLSLQVNNGTLTSAPDIIKITAQQKPIAHITARGFIVGTGNTISLNALESVSPHGEDLSYQWTLMQKPSSSTATLSNSTSAISTFIADALGTYVLSLRVRSDHLESQTVQKSIIVGNVKEQTVITGSLAILDGSIFSNADLSWDLGSLPDGSRARIFWPQARRASFKVDVSGSYIVRWSFREAGQEYFDYSLIHAYPPQGAAIFGPKSPGAPRVPCRLFLGCSDESWDFTVTDLTKSYALIIEHSNVDSGFVYLNGQKIAGRYDFPDDRWSFIGQINVLASNTLKVSFSSNAIASIKVQEMSLSGMENAPPALMAAAMEVVQGETANRQITVTDSGSTTHRYSILEGASYGAAEISENGQLSYTADNSYQGADFVVVKVENANGLAQLIKVIITIAAQSMSKQRG